MIAGELVMLEYPNLQDTVGREVRLRGGYFVDRKPGSIHQLLSRSPLGFASLEVRSGPGNYPYDRNFDTANYTEEMPIRLRPSE